MRISLSTYVNFQRKLKTSEESEYQYVLRKGKELVSNSCDGRTILIAHSASMPQDKVYNTGVGFIGSKKSMEFINFTKKYWGINEIQLLPVGQYHLKGESCPIYSGSSMDFGNHMINLENFLKSDELKKIAKSNPDIDKINYKNIITTNSAQEKALKNLFENMPKELIQEFSNFKKNLPKRLETKSIYHALTDIYVNSDTNKWSEIDKNLYNRNIISDKERLKRLSEIKNLKPKIIDFYLFKQFLAEKSLKETVNKLRKEGIKLNGDMICGFSKDEVWANPEAFIKDVNIGWGLPALDLKNSTAANLVREKANFYAKFFDGIRVDASWTYITPSLHNKYNKQPLEKEYYGDKFLNIIEDEVQKVKGAEYNSKSIMHEFAAKRTDFDMYEGTELKPIVKTRVKIFTSDYLGSNNGTDFAYKKKSWIKDYYILGATNHDSKKISVDKHQADVLAKILKLDKTKLYNLKEFIKAKFAEPMAAKNTMIMFNNALGINESFGANSEFSDNYKIKIPENFEEIYHNALQNGEGFNPMDALEKLFVAKGLDKSEKELFKKIVKYRKILEQKEHKPFNAKTAAIIIAIAGLTIGAAYFLLKSKTKDSD